MRSFLLDMIWVFTVLGALAGIFAFGIWTGGSLHHRVNCICKFKRAGQVWH